MKDRILIVEDEPLLAFDLEDLLHQFGYRVSGIANDLDSAQRLAPYADVAFVDVNLSDGQTGPRIGQFLASEFGVAVIFVTGDEAAIDRGVAGTLGVIAKPVNATKIKAALDYLLELQGGGQPAEPVGMRVFSDTPCIPRRIANF
ncbi:response regulator [Rhizobium sullae]|uniref:Response regulator n=2 Tax=Rhizobium sullae TaxID=50338 RepID=A0A2N0D1A3_RHISU|nr:response regulator [Rhizobium sullae]